MAVTWITAADLENPASEYATDAAETASWILYKLTAEKYAGVRSVSEWIGLHNTDLYTCSTFTDHGDFTWLTYNESRENRAVRLRGRPVVSIQSVTDSDGVVDPASYKLVNSAVLHSVSGPWRLGQGLVVEYTYGTYPPRAGITAAIRLANELVEARTGSATCGLPERVINQVSGMSRQGIDYTFLDPQDFLNEGRTGIYEIDLFIRAANPTNAKKKPRVFSPDIPAGGRS